jgi:hypothetical protein
MSKARSIAKQGEAPATRSQEGFPRPMLRLLSLLMPILLLLCTSCRQSFTPKPEGYLRIDYPKNPISCMKIWSISTLRYPNTPWWRLTADPADTKGGSMWLFPSSTVKYTLVTNRSGNLTAYITDCRELVYKHTVKARKLRKHLLYTGSKGAFGMVYDLKGDVASAVQFFITDSTDHFLGILYFNVRPNRDSLNPVIEFLREDIIHLIETTRWKY